MPLFRLERKSASPVYDVAEGFVVRAKTISEARQLASLRHGDEGSETWLQARHSICNEINPDGPSQIILRDFNAG